MTKATINSRHANQRGTTKPILITLSIVAYACGLSSHMSQRGRQVKFCSKKPSLQVRLTVLNAGRVPDSPPDSVIVEKSVIVDDPTIADDSVGVQN